MGRHFEGSALCNVVRAWERKPAALDATRACDGAFKLMADGERGDQAGPTDPTLNPAAKTGAEDGLLDWNPKARRPTRCDAGAILPFSRGEAGASLGSRGHGAVVLETNRRCESDASRGGHSVPRPTAPRTTPWAKARRFADHFAECWRWRASARQMA